MLKTKDHAAFLKVLAPRAASLRGVAIPGEQASRTAEDVTEAARRWAIPAESAPSVAAAVADLVRQPGPRARILICGSLYLAGTVLRDNG